MASGSDWAYWDAQSKANSKTGKKVKSVRTISASPSKAKLRGISRRSSGVVDLPLF